MYGKMTSKSGPLNFGNLDLLFQGSGIKASVANTVSNIVSLKFNQLGYLEIELIISTI